MTRIATTKVKRVSTAYCAIHALRRVGYSTRKLFNPGRCMYCTSDMKKDPVVPKRVAAYIRVSNPKSNYDSQLNEIHKYLAIRGWPPPTPDLIYTDVQSARKNPSKAPRPGHQRLLLDARTRQFDAIVCWRMDRLARSVDVLVQWKDIAEASGVILVFVAENMTSENDTPMGRLFYSIIAAMAEFNASVIQENREAGQRWARENGGDVGGRPRRITNRKEILAYYEAGNSYKACRAKFKVGKSQLALILQQERRRREMKLAQQQAEAEVAAQLPVEAENG